MKSLRGAAYWNEVIVGRRADRPQALWRAHADRVNTDLCRAWWPNDPPRRVLKTDLFDEASGDGLWPMLVNGSVVPCGIDQAINTIRSARSRYADARGTAADVRRLPFRDEAFDLVVSNSTLDHFETLDEIAAGLAEIARVLRPGGRLILTLDNPCNPMVALRNALPFTALKRMGLVPYFVGATAGPRRGRQLLTAAGFRVADVRAVMHCPRAPAVAAASILDRLGSPFLQRAFASALGAFEAGGRWPSRFLTGYFVAFAAEKIGVDDRRGDRQFKT